MSAPNENQPPPETTIYAPPLSNGTTSTTTSTISKGSHNFVIAIVMGAIVGSILLLLFFIQCVYRRIRRNRRRNRRQTQISESNLEKRRTMLSPTHNYRDLDNNDRDRPLDEGSPREGDKEIDPFLAQMFGQDSYIAQALSDQELEAGKALLSAEPKMAPPPELGVGPENASAIFGGNGRDRPLDKSPPRGSDDKIDPFLAQTFGQDSYIAQALSDQELEAGKALLNTEPKLAPPPELVGLDSTKNRSAIFGNNDRDRPLDEDSPRGSSNEIDPFLAQTFGQDSYIAQALSDEELEAGKMLLSTEPKLAPPPELGVGHGPDSARLTSSTRPPSGTGSNSDGAAIDVLEQDPPSAHDRWRALAGITEGPRRSTFGTVSIPHTCPYLEADGTPLGSSHPPE
jgi:hypothetical protein